MAANRRVRKTERTSLETMGAQERVAWAVEKFGPRLIMTTSFGAQSAVMLHLVTRVKPDIPVVFIDTGYLFPETYRFAEDLCNRLSLNMCCFQPEMSAARQEALFGKQWDQGADGLKEYSRRNKVEPMNRALRKLRARAWMSGVRRQQASTRAERPAIERQNRIWKLYPIIDWTNRDVHRYLSDHDLPYHPLWHEGYASIGDWHSTRPLEPGMLEEETRFGGMQRECGLHVDSGDTRMVL